MKQNNGAKEKNGMYTAMSGLCKAFNQYLIVREQGGKNRSPYQSQTWGRNKMASKQHPEFSKETEVAKVAEDAPVNTVKTGAPKVEFDEASRTWRPVVEKASPAPAAE